ncbi:DnaD domain protein [Staphylococcus condimenti]|uniref:DnaD domain protein n=1 Tax=Staphylococcus condimenti TaxID=70255 RepID=A0AB37H5J4_9STAP|nr:DnaD domain protein [Staphylococcus condimenti]AMY05083.1 DNA replication protein DnaD [Staphylococcus condimenti]PNZ59361.1 DnaD domain protein [Staphylococcus condimenti]QQS83117.1 DnaD domain protein [Staphylococcus condimenti]VEG64667.1 putative phage replication protein [Staphylococcus condimenti]
MATFRTIKESGDFVTVHKTFIYDSNLSAKAKGILLYFLSRPDDWQIYTSEVVKHMNDGQKAINSGIQELIKYKYVHRTQKRNAKGVFNGYEYLVYEKPTEMPFSENGKTENGKSENGKRHTTNNNRTKNDLTNNNDTVSESLKHISNELEMIQSPLKIQEIEELIKNLGNEALDIVKVATDYTRDNNKGINYLIKVLTNWIKEDVDTKEKAENKVKPKKQSSNIDGMLDDLLGSDS